MSERLPFVAPGTGWPEDPAHPDTPVAADPADVAALAATAAELGELEARQSVCRACPRLVEWREQVALQRRKAYADEPYWGRPIAGWGAAEPRVLIVGLAPAAHGGNRTGRIFTGDRSGDWLFASLHRVGLAAQATSIRAGDGQRLLGARMAAAVRCAPPLNKPTNDERDACRPWLHRELEFVLPHLRAVVCLGGFGWAAALDALGAHAIAIPRPRPKFGHGVEVELAGPAGELTLLGSFHPSQQNTFTGRLTEPMLDAVLGRARVIAGLPGPAT
ncbi:MAG: uracil-DNA glycosylase [Sporichthyaceae bacterium]